MNIFRPEAPTISASRDFDGKEGVALVIGGSGGIGQAICLKLAEAGTDVILTYRSSQAAADQVKNGIEQVGQKAHACRLAIDQENQVKKFFDTTIPDLGPIHTIVNASGASISMPWISELTPTELRNVIDSDANGFFNVVHYSLPLLRQTAGSYVAISTAGLKRWPTRDVLSVVPKAAIDALMTGIAQEEGRFGVRANTVALGLIDAGLFQRLAEHYDERYMKAVFQNSALKRLGTAEEVADAVVFFASNRASYVTGQTLVLDGGFSL